MSLRTRTRGFTAWVNLRLKPYDLLMNNVVMDLLSGTNMKMLMQSFTSKETKRIQSFDGLTQQQKITRIEWMIDELKKFKLVPDDLHVDSRLFAMRSADHIFGLLWRLIAHDIEFIWDRLEFLLHESDEVLCEVPFKWIPEPPPQKKKGKVRKTSSLLSGFGASSVVTEIIEEEDMETILDANYDPFPRHDFMKKFKLQPQQGKKIILGETPSPEECIMEMVNKHLKSVTEGRKLHCLSPDDLVDSRVLCAIINSFIPNTFTTEVLLNDRWTINLVLKMTEKMFFMETPFDAEDLVEADQMSVCSYFCAFFMLAYKYRQSKAVVNRVEFLKRALRDCTQEVIKYSTSDDPKYVPRMEEIKNDMDNIKSQLNKLEMKFDLEFCYQWLEHVQLCVKETHQKIREKMTERFDVVPVPRNISINDMCLSLVINLNLTNGIGFYQADGKEVLSEGRKLILRNLDTGDFTEDFSGKSKTPDSTRRILHVARTGSVEIDTNDYPGYEFYFEAGSRNKQLRMGSNFLYQVFPSNTVAWQKVFVKAIKENEIEMVQRMAIFFRTMPAFINCKEPNTGNSPLHWACRLGTYDIALFLLECGANIDQKNHYKQTPLFSACEGLQRELAFLMIEWGCDVHAKGPRGQTAFETIKNDDFRDYLINAYEHYSSVVPSIMAGNYEMLEDMVRLHIDKTKMLSSLRSRCINGSTLLHTAAYFDHMPVIHLLLRMRVDINLLDYKGATPLHRAKDVDTIQLLLEAGAKVSVEDTEGNTPLHVKCYGETNLPSESAAIQLLLDQGAKVTARNNRGLMPIHCCAMQGRVDVIEQLLYADRDGEIRTELMTEKSKTPPSLVHLALANDYSNCAYWLIENGFDFKDGEQDLLMRRILIEQISAKDKAETIRFLLDHGANPNPRYPAGNTALHYAASTIGSNDVLDVLTAYGADVNVTNDENATPLFFACQSNSPYTAGLLLSSGADVRIRNLQGLTAFDFITDYDEWIECGYFPDEIRARLKAFSLKHTRDLIRAISKKVKAPQAHHLLMGRGQSQGSQMALQAAPSMADNSRGGGAPSRMFLINQSHKTGSQASLPPIG